MGFTDYLHLSELKIFKTFKENVKKDLNKTANLLTVKDSVLFIWDFENTCVLTLNVKAARSRDGDNISHQNLLPLVPAVLFKPEFLLANDTLSLLIIAGPDGILVMELPTRYPPHGAFDNNKELVYCRGHNLDERLLLFNDSVQVRQVRFHPGSTTNSHILALTSDNTLRLYNVENSTAVCLKTFQSGVKPVGLFPGTKTSYLSTLGEVAVDFCFGHPELIDNGTINSKSANVNENNLIWPVYILMGDGRIFYMDIPLDKESTKDVLKGPLPSNLKTKNLPEEACAIISLNTYPQVFCIANSNGRIYHSLILPLTENDYQELKSSCGNLSAVPKKELLCFESVELELGLSTSDDEHRYSCPIFLHKDESKIGRYFATHSAGIHSISITIVDDLQMYTSSENSDDNNLDDIFLSDSVVEYLVCTKISNSDKANPVIGFAVFYEPTSIIAILADASLLSLGLLTTTILPNTAHLSIDKSPENSSNTSLKQILNQPFDQIMAKILTKNSNQPIIKLMDGNQTQKDCYELLQRASQVFRDCYFENNTKAREEIEKRVKALRMMKEYQLRELERMNKEKVELQEKAESLAEKYEDMKDKQDLIMKRCERLLLLVSQKKQMPSDAEIKFFNDLKTYKEKMETYRNAIEKLKMKSKYQKIQMENWKKQETKKVAALDETHELTIKTNVKEMTQKIVEMIKEVNEYTQRLNLK